MITLITGLPGAGKTLYAINLVQAEQGVRPVFYHGIPELKLDWFELDNPDDWYKVAQGSIVLLDESQKSFRPRSVGSNVPAHISALETHRHDGIDLYLITQHPMLLDSAVRRLIGRHYHVVRKFGMQRSTVHEWGEVKSDCDKSRSDSIRHEFAYPKKTFDLYKSAELHTHKRRLPMRIYFLLVAPFVVAGLIWFGVHSFKASRENSIALISHPNAVGTSGSLDGGGTKKVSTPEYLSDRMPRIAGLSYTAPAYDGVTKPDDAPYPAACVSSKAKCSCFSQQATSLDVPESLCRQIVSRGYFRDWHSKSDQVAQNNRAAPMNPRTEGASAAGDVNHVATIPAPAHVGLSDGFHAADTPIDQLKQNKPQQRVPTAPQSLPGSG